MSADIHLHIRTEEMTDDHLDALGANGVLHQVGSDVELDEQRSVLDNSPSIFVAESGYKYTDEIINYFSGLQTITEDDIEFMNVQSDKYDIDDFNGRTNKIDNIIEFLESHKGDEVFTFGY